MAGRDLLAGNQGQFPPLIARGFHQKFWRMPRQQDQDRILTVNDNANCPVILDGNDRIGCGCPENVGQRQVWDSLSADSACCGCPQDDGQRLGESKRASNRDQVVRRYTFKLYPNKTQEAELVRQASLLARLWNAAMVQR